MSEQYIQVQNLTDNPVVYNIPEDHLRRVFAPYEAKMLSKDELQKLYYQPGGAVLLHDFLSVRDKKTAVELGVPEELFEHEYSWNRKKVDKVLLEEDIDILHDALDFAPEGIIDLIIERAVALRISDINKRELIQQCTGKNVNQMIATQVQLEQAIGEQKEEAPKQRRATSQTTTESTGRRVS